MDLPKEAVEHLYPFLVLVAALVAAGGVMWKGLQWLVHQIDERLDVRLKILEGSISGSLNPLVSAIQDVDRRLEAHIADEDGRNERRAQELKTEVARRVDEAVKVPAAVYREVKRLDEVQTAHGKALDVLDHRVRVLELKEEA